MKYKVLDIERDVLQQGFETEPMIWLSQPTCFMPLSTLMSPSNTYIPFSNLEENLSCYSRRAILPEVVSTLDFFQDGGSAPMAIVLGDQQ